MSLNHVRKLLQLLIFAAVLPATPAFGQVSGLPGVPHAGLSWYLISFELGPWEEYLIVELTPELEVLEPVSRPRIPWVAALDQALLPEFAGALMGSVNTRTRAFIERRHQRPLLLSTGLGDPHLGFQRQLLTSGIASRMGEAGWLSVSAVLATQQFGYSALDAEEREHLDGTQRYHRVWNPYGEVTHGTGLRVALSREMLPGLSLDAAITSRINMDEFAHYRGVYAQPADFDIPSRVQMGLEVQASRNSALALGVSQIFYSEVAAFPSQALPARFFALLGDATSPEFAWKDLTVYTVGWRWQRNGLSFHLDYSTRSRPEPTSRRLAQALNRELAKEAWLAGVSKRIGRSGELQLNAAYAPAEYAFGGNMLGVITDRLDQELELHARWRWVF